MYLPLIKADGFIGKAFFSADRRQEREQGERLPSSAPHGGGGGGGGDGDGAGGAGGGAGGGKRAQRTIRNFDTAFTFRSPKF